MELENRKFGVSVKIKILKGTKGKAVIGQLKSQPIYSGTRVFRAPGDCHWLLSGSDTSVNEKP